MATKVCHFSTVHTPFDIRIFYKECKSLVNEGYDVNFIVTHDKAETVDGVKIIPLEKKGGRFYRFTVKRWHAYKAALAVDADIYHFHDPELLLVGKLLKRKGKKVIYDVHENGPNMILTREWIKPYLRKIISKLFDGYEKKSVLKFDKVIAARPDIAETFPKNLTVAVRNMPVLKLIDSVEPIEIATDKPVVIYAGGLTKIRGIKEMVDAAGLLEGKIELWLLGGFDYESYKAECMESKGWKYTKYMGQVSQENVYAYMKKATIGITNFLPAPNHNSTLPNKPFEYMTCGLPMVMSNFKYWLGIFGDCALFADPSKPEEIAQKISEIIDNPEIAKKLKDRGRQYVEENYSWEAEQNRLFEVYKELSRNL